MARSTPSRRPSTCYLVGAGPGDPGLLTLRGRECLEQADVVIYDYLANPELLRHARPEAERIYAGKTSGRHAMKQEETNALLLAKAREGKRVVRLKGGDPYVFGRGGEEAAELAAAGIPFEIIPGISSVIAGPAYAGIPLTHRENNAMFTVFTGHVVEGKKPTGVDFPAIASAPGTKVMLMGVENLALVTKELISHGMAGETPAALIRWATTGRQQTLIGTLATIASLAVEKKFQAPAVAVFGDVVQLRDTLSWFESQPLFGKRIAVTRASGKQAGSLVTSLRALGADAFELPTIRIEPPEEKMPLVEAITGIRGYDWIVFTSPNGVESFFNAFYAAHDDAREIGGARIAAIGNATAARIKDFRIGIDLIPKEFVADSLIESFKEMDIENLRILLPRAAGARDLLAVELEKLGAIVDDLPVYRTVPETGDPAGGITRFRDEGADLITFTSASTATHFMALGLPLPEKIRTASIGPVTSSEIRRLGLPVDVEAAQHDIPGLVEAILEFYKQ
jgi:uroporphyrinogen III methyltransferase / synthase